MKSRSGSSNSIAPFSWILGLAFAGLLSTSGVFAEVADEEPVDSNPASFGELLEGFRGMTGLEARFKEEKYLALLAAPLRSHGRLYFAPPRTLLRRVEAPVKQNILIQESHVRISSGTVGEAGEASDVQVIDLAARGGIRPLIESMMWIFTGDRAALEEVYEVDYQPSWNGASPSAESKTTKRWQLQLVPKSAPLSDLLQTLRVRGQGRWAETMELVETSGDRTVTHILDANPRRVFSPAERQELFGASE